MLQTRCRGQYFCLTQPFSELTQIFSEPDGIFCISRRENTPVRGVLKLCLVTSFHPRNRRKCHSRGSRFQIFSGGACPRTPLGRSHLRCEGPAFGGTLFFASYTPLYINTVGFCRSHRPKANLSDECHILWYETNSNKDA